LLAILSACKTNIGPPAKGAKERWGTPRGASWSQGRTPASSRADWLVDGRSPRARPSSAVFGTALARARQKYAKGTDYCRGPPGKPSVWVSPAGKKMGSDPITWAAHRPGRPAFEQRQRCDPPGVRFNFWAFRVARRSSSQLLTRSKGQGSRSLELSLERRKRKRL